MLEVASFVNGCGIASLAIRRYFRGFERVPNSFNLNSGNSQAELNDGMFNHNAINSKLQY
jgi:hypothetical protein